MKTICLTLLLTLFTTAAVACDCSGRLDGKVALITGSACGIGKAHAELFAKEGAAVVITTSKKIDQGVALAQQIREAGGQAVFMKLDVRQPLEWQHVIEQTIERYGHLDVLVNNAGISLAKDIESTSLDEWHEVNDVNATGIFLGMKYAIGAMKQSGQLCSIINISSIDALIGEALLPAYCASKGSITALTKSVALSCAEAGYKIRVNSVHPGYIRTELAEKEAADSGLTIEEYLEKVGAMHPIGHIGESIDVAYMSLYLASDESKWVTGAEFTVDGGYTAQ